MKCKFILFSPGLLKSPEYQGLYYFGVRVPRSWSSHSGLFRLFFDVGSTSYRVSMFHRS